MIMIENLLCIESINRVLKVSSVNCSQQHIDWVIHSLPDLVLGNIHSLLHVATRLKLRLPELTNLCQHSLEIIRENTAATLLWHVLGQQ